MRTFAAAICFCATGLAQSVVIANSGSTNVPGFQIRVTASGEAHYESRARTMDQKASAPLTRKLYADVEAARPLTSLPPRHCMKSASFGSRLTVQFGEEQSPDLSCGDGGDEKLRRLIDDVQAIVQLFSIR